MNEICLEAHGKINLSLDIVGKRENGYHDVQMIMQTIGLSDTVTVTRNQSGQITTESNLCYVPNNETNLAYRAAALFFEACQIPSDGVHIKMEKRIPVGGGLGGGSADAAAVLRGLDELYGTHLSLAKLSELGASLGADVPFCFRTGTYLAEGIGERLAHLPPLPACHVVLVKPNFGVSTKWVYQTLDWTKIPNHPNTLELIRALSHSDLYGVAEGMENVLEPVVFQKYSIISKLKQTMKNYGAIGAMMSGSGATVFGLFDDLDKARFADRALGKEWQEHHLTHILV